MIFQNNRGVLLEQNKEPMLSKDIIRLDSCDSAQQFFKKPTTNAELASPYEILNATKDARIVDESDGKLLWKKMANAVRSGMVNVIVDAIDDEPYISSQLSPSLAYQDKLEEGISLIKRAIGATKATIETYKELTDIEVKIPAKIGNYKIERVVGRYPIEQRAIHSSKRNNSLVVGACALICLRDAVYEGKSQSTCFVTVAGNCITNPSNYQVPVGITVSEVLEIAGLFTAPKRLIVGGSMTGFAIKDPDNTLVTPSTRGILAFAGEFSELEYTCIGCGRCTKACHMGLSPYYIYKVMNSRAKKNLELFDADRCTGCGICSYVCPAKLDLQQTVQAAAKFSQERECKGE